MKEAVEERVPTTAVAPAPTCTSSAVLTGFSLAWDGQLARYVCTVLPRPRQREQRGSRENIRRQKRAHKRAVQTEPSVARSVPRGFFGTPSELTRSPTRRELETPGRERLTGPSSRCGSGVLRVGYCMGDVSVASVVGARAEARGGGREISGWLGDEDVI